MKRFKELTDKEILLLSKGSIERFINYEMMIEGIKLSEVEAPKKPIIKHDMKVYTIEGFDGYCFLSMQDAERVASLIKSSSVMKIENVWSLNDKCVSDVNYNTMFCKPFEVKSVECYKSDTIKMYKEEIDKYDKAMAEYNKNAPERERNEIRAKGIKNEIYSEVNRVKNKYNEADRLANIFIFEYCPLSDNDPSVAIKFMSKAYDLSQWQEEYILSKFEEKKNNG